MDVGWKVFLVCYLLLVVVKLINRIGFILYGILVVDVRGGGVVDGKVFEDSIKGVCEWIWVYGWV